MSKPNAVGAPSIWRLVSGAAREIVSLGGEGAGPPIVCVHSVAGDIGGFDALAGLLGPDQRFYGIQVPKARMNAGFSASVEAMAARYIDLVATIAPRGAIVVAGFSAGAIVALEMARVLRAQGREVPYLLAFDGAPNNSGAELAPRHPRYLLALLRNLPHWMRAEDRREWSPRGLSQRLVNRFVFRAGRPLPGIVGAHTMHVDTVSRLLDRPEWRAEQRGFIRAMFNAMHAYVPAPYDGRVILYETRAQPLFRLLQLGTVWAALAPRLEIVPLPGKHPNFFHGTTTIGPLAAHLRGVMEILTREAGEDQTIRGSAGRIVERSSVRVDRRLLADNVDQGAEREVDVDPM